MPQPKPITTPVQLVVEGEDAANFFKALLREMNLTTVQVQNFGGVTELRSFLKLLRDAPNFWANVTSIGIVRDAETDPKAAFQSVCGALRHAGLPVPQQPAMPAGHQSKGRGADSAERICSRHAGNFVLAGCSV